MVLWCLFADRAHPWMDAEGRLVSSWVVIAGGVMRGTRPDLAALRPATPPAVRDIIRRCWAHDPSARPTASAVSRETEAWQGIVSR